MKILIIGNNSFIGKRLSTGLKHLGKVYLAGRSGKYDRYFSLTDQTFVSYYTKFDVIIHCAASFANSTIEGILENERTNALGAIHVANLAKETKCKHVINCGTIFSYSVTANEYFDSYGISKKHGDEILNF